MSLRLCRSRFGRTSLWVAVISLGGFLGSPLRGQQSQESPVQTQPGPAAEGAVPGTDEARAGLQAARAAYLRQQWQEALPGLEDAARDFPDDALVHYQLGFCLDRTGDRERALEHKRRARDLFGEQAEGSQRWEPYYYLSALQGLDFGDKEKARELAVLGLARIDESEELSGVACFRASRLAGFAERPEDAARWMDRAAERFAVEEEPPPVYANEALWHSGEKAFRAADYELARDRLERAASLSATANDAWYLAGVARLRLGDDAGAVQSFRRLEGDQGRTEGQYAIRLVQRSKDQTLPEALPDGRPIGGMRDEDQASALRRACTGEFEEESEILALALLMDFLKRGQVLRELTLRSSCVAMLFQ